MKTSELTGAALDWAVAKCEGKAFAEEGEKFKTAYSPSTDWSQGGPIIERERIGFGFGVGIDSNRWEAGYATPEETGHTPLIAAMRCYVASKLGDQVDVPEELCPPTD